MCVECGTFAFALYLGEDMCGAICVLRTTYSAKEETGGRRVGSVLRRFWRMEGASLPGAALPNTHTI